MTATALRLFGTRVRATHAASSITESSPERLRLARTTGRTVLADYEDAPQAVEEVDGGMVVLGGSHALFLPSTGDVVVKSIGEAKPKPPSGGGSRKPLPSKNESYGFTGTVKGQLGGTAMVFAKASEALLKAFPQHSPETIRSFLDSKWGRYLAEELPKTAHMANVGDGYALQEWFNGCQSITKVAWLAKELEKYAKLPPEDAEESVDSPAHLAEAEGATKKCVQCGKPFKPEDASQTACSVKCTRAYVLTKGKTAKGAQDESALTEDSDDLFTAFVGFSDLFKRTSDRMVVATQFARLKSAVERAYEKAGRTALLGALGAALNKDPEVTKLMADLKLSFSKTVDRLIHDSKDSDPMTTRLQEEDYADIVVGDDGLFLLVNGEIVAQEACDLNSEDDCLRAEAALAQQASALGYTEEIDEGTFDASNEKGGKVVNGDQEDDWQSGEGYYARRYRRRTSDAETGKPTMPALESWRGLSDAKKLQAVAEVSPNAKADALVQMVDELDAAAASGAAAYQRVSEKFVPFKKKGKEDAEDVGDDDEVGDDEDMEESLVREVTTFLGEHVDPNQHIVQIREYDRLVRDGDYEGALDLAESLVVKVGQLDEYKRRTGASLSKFRRSLKMQTSQEKVRNRQRRKEYRTNTTMRRKAARYRMRVKRFMRPRRTESVVSEGRSATKAEALAKKKAGHKFAVWSTEKDVTYHKTEAEARAEAKKNPKPPADAVDPDWEGQGRTWTDIDELIDVLESAGAPRVRNLRENADTTWQGSYDGKAGADETFKQAAAGVFGDIKGEYTTFAGLKERVEKVLGGAVSDPKLMRVVSEFVNRGLVRYTPGKGYALAEVEAEQAMKLAKAARTAGNKFVVTIAGGSPIFLPTQEDAKELWKSLPPKMRGMKVTLAGYLESLGVEEEDEGEES